MDTIVAPATPTGESALGVIRVSGELASGIYKEACKLSVLSPRKATLANYISFDGILIDQVVITYYEDQKSYTGQKSLEISCHGNPLILELICEDLINRGCRLAEPGEFTKLAYTNGKLDLAQAESVAQIISAKNERALQAAQRNLQGQLGDELKKIQNQTIELQAFIEGYIDFPEDDIGNPDPELIKNKLDTIISEINKLINQSERIQIFEQTFKIVLIGPPNAGKSSLFNQIVGSNRAIVHPTAGTTRDYLEKNIMLNKQEVTIVDTAGIHEGSDEIENLGIEHSCDQAVQANLLLFVVDGTLPYPTQFLNKIYESVKHVPKYLIINKSDLKSTNLKVLHNFIQTFTISCKNNNGIDSLIKEIERYYSKKYTPEDQATLYIGKRHHRLLKVCNEYLYKIEDNLKTEIHYELISSELQSSRDALDQIIGIKTNEDILDQLFKRFCIGK